MRNLSIGIAAVLVLIAAAPRGQAQVAVSPDGKFVAMGLGTAIAVKDVATQKDLIRIQAHTLVVSSLVYSPDGRLLISGSLDKTAHVFDAPTGKLIRTFRIEAAVAMVSTDGKVVTILDVNKKTRAFNIDSGAEVKVDKK